MKRTELRRRLPLARTSSLTWRGTAREGRNGTERPQAERLAGTRPAGNPVPADIRAALRDRSGGRCEIAAPGCAGGAREPHHRIRRRDGGHGLANLLDTCRPCHDGAHQAPSVARDMGWIVSAFTPDPAAIPVRHGDRLTWLHDDGTKITEEIARPATATTRA